MVNKKILYAHQGGLHVFKLIGELRFDSGYAFEQALTHYENASLADTVIMDLQEATLIDSTILGLICGLIKSKHDAALVAWVTHANIKKTLKQVGLDHFFAIVENPHLVKLPVDFEEMSHADEEQLKVKARVHQAHQRLMELSDYGHAQFKSVTDKMSKH